MRLESAGLSLHKEHHDPDSHPNKGIDFPGAVKYLWGHSKIVFSQPLNSEIRSRAMSHRGRRCGLAASSVLLLLLCGCGPSTDRRPLHGHVKIDGVAIPHGSIRFLPAPGSSGPAASATIVDGEYRFTDESGPHDGPHQVWIDVDLHLGTGKAAGQQGTQAVKPANSKAIRPRFEQPRPPGAKIEPPAKSRWEVEYTVPEDGVLRKDFDLTE